MLNVERLRSKDSVGEQPLGRRSRQMTWRKARSFPLGQQPEVVLRQSEEAH
ncbi:hypothetical protein ACFPRL_16350 [Pseudoclavibacter helvolus]